MMHLLPGNAGQLVAELREMRGLSQSALGKSIGMSQAMLSKIESGERTPSVPAFLRILDGLDARLVIELKEDT